MTKQQLSETDLQKLMDLFHLTPAARDHVRRSLSTPKPTEAAAFDLEVAMRQLGLTESQKAKTRLDWQERAKRTNGVALRASMVELSRVQGETIALNSATPPREFRIFRAGAFSTSKGDFTFGASSASEIMKASLQRGTDYPIDYEHASIAAFFSADPSEAGKAAGWFKPEVRAGELWAAGVSWTPKGADHLRNREYRYMSPTFLATKEGLITDLVNVALTNMPATHGLEPLVPSSRR